MMANEPYIPAGPGAFVVLSDSPSLDGDDPLEFEAMAGRLERIIVASRTSAPFTASIEAGWGAGKSTLMRRVQRRLEGKAPDQTQPATDARTVWFNAWTAPETQVLEGLVRSVLPARHESDPPCRPQAQAAEGARFRSVVRRRLLRAGEHRRSALAEGVGRPEAAQRAERVRPRKHGAVAGEDDVAKRPIVVFTTTVDAILASR